ncbi:MAG TPA: Xaa-Pro peptidase family protein [Solirubrobacteraceae bacterium]|nr:Xaa-Pro peptidase family protein [Solirubrobacteraceae bacterium]
MTSRLDAVAAKVAERELDLLLVSDLANVRWLTGFTGSNGAAVVGGAAPRFVTDFRYLTQAAEQLAPEWEREIDSDVLKRVAKGLPDGPLKLGFDDDDLTVKQHAQLAGLLDGRDVELVAAGGIVEALRAVKDADEIDRIRAAARLADEAFEEVVGAGVVGRTEREVALDLEIAMRRRGAQGPSFAPIVAAGEHGARPHAEPRDVSIPAGTLVVIDWGAQLDGYASDCTRTVATGELDPRDRAIYETVLVAQQAALAAVRAGPTGREVDAVARAIIDDSGHAEHFGHGLGHGVGMEVHEGPRLSKQGDEPLAAGNVVTVEPGIYVPGAVGVRIEDLVVVTADGHEVLSGLPKTLRTVD